MGQVIEARFLNDIFDQVLRAFKHSLKGINATVTDHTVPDVSIGRRTHQQMLKQTPVMKDPDHLIFIHKALELRSAMIAVKSKQLLVPRRSDTRSVLPPVQREQSTDYQDVGQTETKTRCGPGAGSPLKNNLRATTQLKIENNPQESEIK